MDSNESKLNWTENFRKLARIWTGMVITLILITTISERVFSPSSGEVPASEWLLLVLFPLIPLIAMLMAFRWELWGSLAALGSCAAFFFYLSYLREEWMPQVLPLVLLVVAPALLFLLSWYLDRKRRPELV